MNELSIVLFHLTSKYTSFHFDQLSQQYIKYVLTLFTRLDYLNIILSEKVWNSFLHRIFINSKCLLNFQTHCTLCTDAPGLE